MLIRKGTEEDFNSCIKIAEELTDFFNPTGIRLLTKDISEHALFVICDENDIYGFITICRKSERVAEISWLAVKKEKQNLGFGSQLINWVSDYLIDRSFKLLEAKTLSVNSSYSPYENTRKFYEKSGFYLVEKDNICPEWDPENPCAIYIKVF
jgi:GNAT superfamily N-acetyltransferase